VLRPELLPLHEQLLHYCSAEHLIFTEGSALNGLLLLGRSTGDLTFIQRRPKLGFTRASYERRARRVEYLNLLVGLVHGLRYNGRDRLHEAISLFDEEAMVSYLRTIDPRLVPLWDSARYREARDRDIRRWIEVESRNPASRAPGSGRMVFTRLAELGLHHLVPVAKQQLPDT
jgi:hypothetical protein